MAGTSSGLLVLVMSCFAMVRCFWVVLVANCCLLFCRF